MIKVGMLGAGFILASHARSVAAIPGTILSTIGDVSTSRAAKASQDFGFRNVVTSIEAMAVSDCNVVHILLPPSLHERAARMMIEAGKSVFIEKPYVLDSADGNSLADLAEQKCVQIGVNHNFLFGNGYQPLREMVREGGLGRLDAVAIDWQYQLPFIKHGPFDNWIVSGPTNPLYEIAPHPLAFALDLTGGFEIVHVDASDHVRLPSGISMPQRWRILGNSPQGSVVIHVALTSGHESRALSVRGEGGAVRYDYGRDIGLLERRKSDNPMLDTFMIGRAAIIDLKKQVGPDLRRRVRAALGKQPASAPFEESIARSIAAFYQNLDRKVDPRHEPRFAAETIRLVEMISQAAKVGGPNNEPLTFDVPPPLRASNILVVGGTGFIGRALVKRLLDQGHGVRVLTRGANGAALALAGLPVEIFAGSHGDEVTVAAALDGIEVVYHLAKCEGRRWQDYVDGDLGPTKVLAKAAAAANVRRFIYTGTIDSYDSAHASKRIVNGTPVDKHIRSRNLYARSKAACEEVLRNIERDSGLNVVIMRPGIVIGAGSPPAHLGVGRFTSETEVEFWGDGANKLPFVHVDDVADALAKAANAPDIDSKSFLVSGPPLLSAQDYVAALEEFSGSRIATKSGSPFRFWLADFVKETAKAMVRHPNRRSSTLHDWQCRAHRSQYDSTETERLLGWRPIADIETLRRRGVAEAVSA
ncbi:MAG: NAD-dependent epimerase/dehydratase family protein [Alphaproteobacteria bacterium]|nr:NAD-dependent epimerase/dehydratase family protein [Alphaproteobacteria bacterium]MBU0864251.1 NAD-dependent epimerase/dehydratase family protein [Alphaproteobacteria bacterium]MBU1825626.1 NAD-dependent epimerase/dehydratase family protein [Alphaproteobacteria bacterium]